MYYEEEKIQQVCVHNFRFMYPSLHRLLHHSANEGHGDQRRGARLKGLGVQPGFPDLWLSVPRNGYHGLYIEMKTKTGRQSPEQKEYQMLVEGQGYKYVICRSYEQFREIMHEYLGTEEADIINAETFRKLTK